MGSSSTAWVSESNTHAGVSKVFSSSTWDAIVSSTGLKIIATEATAALIEMWADDGDDNADKWKWQVADAGLMTWQSYTAGSYATKLTLNTSGGLIAAGDMIVAATNKMRFDGSGGHSYIIESSDDIVDIYVGAANMMKFTESVADKIEINGANLEIDATQKLYFDGGADTYIHESGSDVLAFNVGGAAMMNLDQDNGIINVGVDDTGYDVKLFGATSGKYWLWDQSADGVVQQGTLTVGTDDTGYDVKFFGATSGRYMMWDESEDALHFTDTTGIALGTGSDLTLQHTSGHSYISNAVGTLYIATLTSGIPVTIGHTTSVTTIQDELDVTGTVDINDTTDASSKTTGALKVDGGVGIVKKLFVGTDLDVDGVTNLDAVDIDGTTQIDATLSVGVDGTGYDVKFFGDTSSRFWLWDQSADGVVQYSTLTVGVDDTGYDVKFFGATAGAYLEWDESANELELRGGAATAGKLLLSTAETTMVDGNKMGQIDFQAPLDTAGTDAILVGASIWAEADNTFSSSLNATELVFATAASETAAEKVRIASDGKMGIGTATPASLLDVQGTVQVGVDDTGYDVKFFGATASSHMLWDESADTLKLVNAYLEGAKIICENVTADDSLIEAESGKMFIFTDAAAVLTLPDSGGGDLIGVTYTFISNFQGTGQEVKCADTTNEKFVGAISVADTDDITSAGTITAEAAQGLSSIEFTGTTEGEPGSMFKLTNIAADVWFIEGMVLSAGTSANPFATS